MLADNLCSQIQNPLAEINMIVTKLIVLFVSVILVPCESNFVDTIKGCTVKDEKCQQGHIQSILRDASKTGISELGIGILDPLKLKEEHVTVLDIVDITLNEGIVKGVQGCKVLKYFSNFETGHVSAEVLCDITVKGKYKVTSSSPLIKTFLGGETVHGEGNGKVKIDKIKLSFEFPFEIIKKNNDFYIKCHFEKAKYNYDILGKAVFHADKLYLGKEEASGIIVKVLNENWKVIMDTAAKSFLDVAMKYVYDIIGKFCDGVPAKVLITDDLASYVIN